MKVAPTTIRLTPEARDRIIKLVGENRMSAFIRDAVDEKLARDERAAQDPALANAAPAASGDWLWLVGEDQPDA